MMEWIKKIVLAVCVVLILATVTEIYKVTADRRRMTSVCGEWSTVLSKSRMVIKEKNDCFTLTFYRATTNGFKVSSSHRLQCGRCLYYGRGKDRTYLWLSEDGTKLQLIPGDCYKRYTTSTLKK